MASQLERKIQSGSSWGCLPRSTLCTRHDDGNETDECDGGDGFLVQWPHSDRITNTITKAISMMANDHPHHRRTTVTTFR